MTNFKEFALKHKYAIAGIACAVVLIILLFTVGFWGTLLLGVFVGVGYFIGSSIDKGFSPIDRLFRIVDRIKMIFKK